MDDWAHAADNSKRCYDTAIDALRQRLEASRVQLAPNVTLYRADCLEVLPTLWNIHACVTDPPYELAFMGRHWDASGVSFKPETWKAVLKALLPGAHLLAFSGTRTYHRMGAAIEDAGFEIRDCVAWLYAVGFPKSRNISIDIDKAAGAEREIVGKKTQSFGDGFNEVYGSGPDKGGVQIVTAPATEAAKQWAGYGTALKPAFEPICLARKPLGEKTVAGNVRKHGAGALNIDGCRIGIESTRRTNTAEMGYHGGNLSSQYQTGSENGRWPANVTHDGSEEVLALFPRNVSRAGGRSTGRNFGQDYEDGTSKDRPRTGHSDSGSAARFFYSAKVSPKERGDSKHPTMKPVALMEWLCKLVTPPGGTVLDPFMGSGSTGIAAIRNGFGFIGIEQDPESFETARRRIENELKARGEFQPIAQEPPAAVPLPIRPATWAEAITFFANTLKEAA